MRQEEATAQGAERHASKAAAASWTGVRLHFHELIGETKACRSSPLVGASCARVFCPAYSSRGRPSFPFQLLTQTASLRGPYHIPPSPYCGARPRTNIARRTRSRQALAGRVQGPRPRAYLSAGPAPVAIQSFLAYHARGLCRPPRTAKVRPWSRSSPPSRSEPYPHPPFCCTSLPLQASRWLEIVLAFHEPPMCRDRRPTSSFFIGATPPPAASASPAAPATRFPHYHRHCSSTARPPVQRSGFPAPNLPYRIARLSMLTCAW